MHTSINLHQNTQYTPSDSPDLTQQKRLANFLSLANIKLSIPQQLFDQVKEQMNNDQDMPERVDWDGKAQNCSFEEYNLISGLHSSPQLPILLANQQNLSTKIQTFLSSKGSSKFKENPVKNSLSSCHLTQFGSNSSRLAQICNFKNRFNLKSQFQNQITKSKQNALRDVILNQDSEMYSRMKTVFGHAIMADGSGTPIYNCLFDQSGKFIITGADDGIIKIWNKDNMVLQASLHGHQDVIIYITVSNCNRFMASASKEGTLIIWDLQNCSIIKRITEDYHSQINNLKFIMMECNTKQANKNFASLQQNNNGASQFHDLSTQDTFESNQEIGNQQKCYDQFLASCSDDGFIMIYDVSSFTLNGSEEFYLKSESNNLYVPYHRSKNSCQNDITIASKLKEVINVKEVEDDDQEDKIQRKTRKRKHGQISLTNQTTANSSSQSQPNTQPLDIFKVKLRADDFRAANRNKHIDSFSVNSKGYVVGGTNHGEIYLWKVRFDVIRSKKVDGHYQWINSFKLHKKAIHYLQFNPAGDILLCGSADGTTSLYDTSFQDKSYKNMPKANEDPYNEIFEPVQYPELDVKFISLGEPQLIHKFEEKSLNHELICAIDCANWSCNGRYALCAINIKKQSENSQENKDNKQAIVKIKVFDTVSGKEIKNLNKACGHKNMVGFACTMKSHPFNDDILVVSYDGGINILYDLKQHTVLQEIVEYGIYSIDQFTMNNQMDVDFSPCGDWLAFSSVFGTLSLYTTQAHRKIQYQCTRVQQFFYYDNENHDKNIFETLDCQPQLCGYELNPYEVQPTPPIIGKFKKTTQTLSPQDFYKQQLFAKEFAIEEENFYLNQLRDGMRQGYFENNQNSLDVQRNEAQNEQRLFSNNRPQNNIGDLMDADMHYGSDMELIGGTREMRQRRTRRLGNARRTLTRNDDHPEEIQGSDEEEEDEPFKDDQSNQQSVNDDYDDDDDFASLQSETHNDNRISGGRRFSPNPIRRQNYHMQTNNRRQALVDEDESMDDGQRPNRNLQQNGNRRQNGVFSQVQNHSQSTNQSGRAERRLSRQRLRQVIHSGETSQFEERPDDQSDFGGGRRIRNQMRNRNRLRNERIDLLSSDEDSAKDFSSDESQAPRIKCRNSRQRNSRHQYNDEYESDDQMKTRTRNKKNRKTYKDDIEMSENISYSASASKYDLKITDEDLKLEEIITKPAYQVERDDNYSVRASKNKHNEKIQRQHRFPAFPQNQDHGYVIDTKIKTQGVQTCAFCQREITKDQLTGPFVRNQCNDNNRLDSQDFDEPLYFHFECLEINQYVRWNDESDSFINIGFAMKQLVQKKSYNCYRCFNKGASIQCFRCDRAFHGHLCSKYYTIPQIYEGEKFPKYLCIFCKGIENNIELGKESMKFAAKHLNDIRKQIPRDHLLREHTYKQTEFYLPQIGDKVRYFWQGHEKFHQSHNCYFYCGSQKKYGSVDLPWLAQPKIKNFPECQIGCEVISISHKFPHAQTEYLIDLYGETSFEGVNQTSQIVSYIELQITDPLQIVQSKVQNFQIALFPNEVANYIVPEFLYMKKSCLFQQSKAADKLIGKRFKTTNGKVEVQVISVNPYEPQYAPLSLWQNILVKDVSTQSIRPQRGRISPSNIDLDGDASRINFWELIYPEESNENFQIEVPQAFETNETQRMMDCMALFFNKKSDICFDFLERVQPSLAPDYKCFISTEMWLQLIFNRIQNFYYRSQDQLWFDLDLISHCSMIYNGEEDELTLTAQGTIEKIRKELKNQINNNNEKKIQLQKQQKKFNINSNQQNPLGFTENSTTPNKSSVNGLKIGNGGIDIKKHLEQNMEKTDNKERVAFIEEVDGQCLIILDFKASPESSNQNILRKGRGRPKKSPMNNDHDFLISIDQNEAENDESFQVQSIQTNNNRRRQRRDISDDDEDETILGKRSLQQMLNPESTNTNQLIQKEEGSLSNQENKPLNTRRHGVITIDLNDNGYSNRRSNRLRKPQIE